jgi:hypothetical protein
MLDHENYFKSIELPPAPIHLATDLQVAYSIESQALARVLAVIDALSESDELPYPATLFHVVEVLKRHIYFDPIELIPFREHLESLQNPKISRHMLCNYLENQLQGTLSTEKMTYRSMLGVLCVEFSYTLEKLNCKSLDQNEVVRSKLMDLLSRTQRKGG